MRVQIASDLHLEFYESRLPPATAFRPADGRDVLVLAGDIGRHMQAREFVLRELRRSPVVYVPGNHEYYSMQRRATIDADWRQLAIRHVDLHYLVAEQVEIDGVRFWGAPWYSDLWGAAARDDVWELRRIRQAVNDFQLPYNGLGAWTVRAHVAAHAAQTELLRAHARQVDVVVTHWPPTLQAMHPKYRGSAINSYFYNQHDELVCEIGACLWISGHTHEAWDCQVGITRCVGNPTGYRSEQQRSPYFDPARVVEVEGWGDTPEWERPYIPPEGVVGSGGGRRDR